MWETPSARFELIKRIRGGPEYFISLSRVEDLKIASLPELISLVHSAVLNILYLNYLK